MWQIYQTPLLYLLFWVQVYNSFSGCRNADFRMQE
jgi:hypothetical protein